MGTYCSYLSFFVRGISEIRDQKIGPPRLSSEAGSGSGKH